MARLALIAAVLALAACGADGDPERPASATGSQIEGAAWIGVYRGGA